LRCAKGARRRVSAYIFKRTDRPAHAVAAGCGITWRSAPDHQEEPIMKNFPEQLTSSTGMPMFLDANRLLLAFQTPGARDGIDSLLKELDLFLEGEVEGRERPVQGQSVNHTERRLWVQSGRAIDDARYQKIESALRPASLDWIGPVYRLANADGRRALVSPLPHVVLVKMRDQRVERQARETFNTMFAATAGEPVPAVQEDLEKSKYLNGHRYFVITNPRELNAYQLRQRLLQVGGQAVADVQFETMPLMRDWCVVPNDTLFAQQWGMTQIQAPQAWDISTGNNAVVVAVIDSGTDLTHPDLQLAGPGIDLGDMVSDGSPNNFGNMTGHGTCCSGIAAATFNNAAGVSGVAGACRILPLAISTFSDVEIANGLNWAVAQGADAISMSFTIPQSALVDTALANAFTGNVVLCAATGNSNVNGVGYPARHASVMAIGASDQIDNRKTPASPDAEGWGSNFGAQMSVVAPGVRIPSTDIQGAGGFNTTAGAGGDYFMTFNGTSSATPHVAGLAVLIRSQYPALTSAQIRSYIERSAQKTGAIAYAETAGHPSGTWNQEMGYGRINAFRSLDLADVMIKDAPGDTGAEPSTSGNFWDFSDIVVRITDDNVFNPANPSQSKNVERGQTNYIYVQVTNNGPREARNVAVNIRITPYVGLQFVYPGDWTDTNATHVNPASVVNNFAAVPAGSAVIAKFTISAAQVEALYGWQTNNPWHPCLLAQVTADNDYAYATADLSFGNIVVRKNNFAQRNLSVIDVFASAGFSFPFIAGNLRNAQRMMALAIDRSRLPAAMPLLLSLDDDGGAFPQVDFDAAPTVGEAGQAQDSADSDHDDEDGCGDQGVVFLERTRINTRLGCCPGVMTLEKGSRFDCIKAHKLGKVQVKGGDVILRGGRRYVEIRESYVTVQVEKAANRLYALSLRTTIPATAQKGEAFYIQVAQQNDQGTTVGGATMVYVVK
jgi:Subtilase family